MTIGNENNFGLIEEQPGYQPVPLVQQPQQPISYPQQPIYQEDQLPNEKQEYGNYVEPNDPNTLRIEVPISATQWSEIQTFHVISIICVIVSFFFVFAEIIPLVLICAWKPKIWRTHNKQEEVFLLVDYVLTLVVTLVSIIGLIFCTIFSLGLCLIFVVFYIPYPIVSYYLYTLYRAQREGTLPFNTDAAPISIA